MIRAALLVTALVLAACTPTPAALGSPSPIGVARASGAAREAATSTPAPTAAATATEAASATPAPTAEATAVAAAATPTPAPTTAPTVAPTAAPTEAPTAAPTAVPTAVPTASPSPTPVPTVAVALIPRPAVPTSGLAMHGRVTNAATGQGIGNVCITVGPPIRCFKFTSNGPTAADVGYYAVDLSVLGWPSGSIVNMYFITQNTPEQKLRCSQFYTGQFPVTKPVPKSVAMTGCRPA